VLTDRAAFVDALNAAERQSIAPHLADWVVRGAVMWVTEGCYALAG